MTELNLTGGAKIGFKRASYPFASLKLNNGVLELDASLIGKYVFLPGDVISIGRYLMPGFGKEGIRIYHNVAGYNEKIVFQSLKVPANDIIKTIEASGFLNKESSRNFNLTQREKEVRQLQASGAFPIKKSFGIAFIVMWNVLFIGSFATAFLNNRFEKLIPLAALPALGFLAAVAILLLVSPGFARIILKEGRTVKDIRKFLFFILFIATFMLVNMYVIMNVTSK
ncbi:hypothetical protein AAEO56_15735 [Flavobacterium sp. DGU11]|uniref:Uncharacterized protein n=1 Tax=Flavobacterium arundinis TaxID=3139143 RepID=A0ABU9I134_9FLAO